MFPPSVVDWFRRGVAHEPGQEMRHVDLPGVHQLMNEELPGSLLAGLVRIPFPV